MKSSLKYGLLKKTSQKWLTVVILLTWMTFMDDCHGWLSWMTFMDDWTLLFISYFYIFIADWLTQILICFAIWSTDTRKQENKKETRENRSLFHFSLFFQLHVGTSTYTRNVPKSLVCCVLSSHWQFTVINAV